MSGPPLSRISRGGARLYGWKGNEYPSVTTILNATMPKPALVGWAARSTAEWAVDHRAEWTDISDRQAAVDLLKGAPFRDRDKAGEVGTAVHRYAEQIARGEDVSDIGEEVRPFVPHYSRFLADWNPTYIETEATVFSLEMGYAGTLDAIARIPGLGVVLLDTKTSRAGVFPETALQLAAYEAADFIGRNDGTTEDEMPEVEQTVVLHLRPDGYRLVPLRVDADTHRQWRRCVGTYGYITGPHATTVGLDLAPAGPR